MTKQQLTPNYLPAVTDHLEHVAALSGIRVAPAKGELAPASGVGARAASARPWLGTDFTHVIVSR